MSIVTPDEILDEVIGKLSAAALQASPNDDQIIAGHVRDSVALLLKYRHKVRERATLPAGEQVTAKPAPPVILQQCREAGSCQHIVCICDADPTDATHTAGQPSGASDGK